MAREAMVTVVVGDDHPMYREGVVRAMKESGRYPQVVAEVGDGRGGTVGDPRTRAGSRGAGLPDARTRRT